MDIVTNQKGGGQGSSKASLASKDVPPKSSAAPAKGTSSSSAEASKSTVPEKAKIQDKNVAAAAAVPNSSGSKAKIQDKTPDKGVEASAKAQIQDKDVGEATVSGCLSSLDMPELRQIAANLRPLLDRSGVQLPHEPQILARDVVAEGSSLACDEVPANTFVMSAQAVEPFVTTANRIRLPQVEEELMLHGGDTLYKPLLSLQVKSLAITHASLRQYRELSRMKADRDSLRKDLSVLETKVKEKEEALALSNKRLADLSSEKEALIKSAKDFELKVVSLDNRLKRWIYLLRRSKMIMMTFAERLMPSTKSLLRLLKLRSFACLEFADKSEMLLSLWGLFLTSFLKMLRSSIIKLGLLPTFRMLSKLAGLFQITLCILLFGIFFALLRLEGFGDHIDESFWGRDSSDFSSSEFGTPKDSPDVMPGKCAAPESLSPYGSKCKKRETQTALWKRS
ncbi:hypothetical protein EJB05_53014, partial [Eragrostis curvula]